MRDIIVLSNGKKVANFSSPHPFTFTDGSIIPAVPDERSELLKIVFHEVIENDKGDVSLSFDLSDVVIDEMQEWVKLYDNGKVDVVFCPLPMIIAIADRWSEKALLNSPFRGIRMEDRIKKLASIDKQCLAKGQS